MTKDRSKHVTLGAAHGHEQQTLSRRFTYGSSRWSRERELRLAQELVFYPLSGPTGVARLEDKDGFGIWRQDECVNKNGVFIAEVSRGMGLFGGM